MKQKYSKCPSCGFATLYTEPQRSEQPQEWTPEMVAATWTAKIQRQLDEIDADLANLIEQMKGGR
jgi:hypothetical protein